MNCAMMLNSHIEINKNDDDDDDDNDYDDDDGDDFVAILNHLTSEKSVDWIWRFWKQAVKIVRKRIYELSKAN